MINNNDGPIVDPTVEEVVEHPQHVLDAMDVMGFSHPDYEG